MPSIPQVTVKSLLQSNVALVFLLQIPGNTGCIARTCAATCVGLHLVEVSSLLPDHFSEGSFRVNGSHFVCLCIHLSNLPHSIFICNIFHGWDSRFTLCICFTDVVNSSLYCLDVCITSKVHYNLSFLLRKLLKMINSGDLICVSECLFL